MWRVAGLFGRVLHRYHANAPLRLPQNHHVEDEVINTSTVLSTSLHSSDSSSQNKEDEEKKKKKRTVHFGYADLPRYTALDAVGWGAAAALFLHVCRRIHSQFSSGTESSSTPRALTIKPSILRNCGHHMLLEIVSSKDVFAEEGKGMCLQDGEQSLAQSSGSGSGGHSSSGDSCPNSNTEQNPPATDLSISDHHVFLQDLPLADESLLSANLHLENEPKQEITATEETNNKEMSDEEQLEEAALNFRTVGDTNIPIILNIIGIQSTKSENYEESFACFLAAAQQGYSKAQFNTGVCYEMGRGVRVDKEKASHYYRLAAVGGHKQAQYRFAKLLLTSRGNQSMEELTTAINLLEQASAAGLTKAQICLASLYSREPVRNENKSVKYLQMAAQSQDDTALLLLGQCYERGFGVQPNPKTALELYKRAARAGNKRAKALLTPGGRTHAQDAALRSIRSSPCFSLSDRHLQQPLCGVGSPFAAPSFTLPFLPHSWSTGSLDVPPSPSSSPPPLHPSGAEGAACRWTVGIG